MSRERIEPSKGQESVWDYPRPPGLERCRKRIQILCDEITIADTSASYRVLETSHPPVYYLPPESVRMDSMVPSKGGSCCEWKGHAHYYALELPNRTIADAAWCYPTPTNRFEPIAGYLAFYPSKMDLCLVDHEPVEAQPGDFYGGWITHDVVGPFKGGPGSMGW